MKTNPNGWLTEYCSFIGFVHKAYLSNIDLIILTRNYQPLLMTRNIVWKINKVNLVQPILLCVIYSTKRMLCSWLPDSRPFLEYQHPNLLSSPTIFENFNIWDTLMYLSDICHEFTKNCHHVQATPTQQQGNDRISEEVKPHQGDSWSSLDVWVSDVGPFSTCKGHLLLEKRLLCPNIDY